MNDKFPALYRGVVEDNVDPEKLGRCKVRVPSIHGELLYPPDALPWARPLVLSPVRYGKGSVNIPDKGDIVWVLFEGSMKEYPIYFGGTYAKGEMNIDTEIVDFYIEEDSRISYNREKKEYTISIGDKSISLSHRGIDIKGNISVSGTITADDIVKRGD